MNVKKTLIHYFNNVLPLNAEGQAVVEEVFIERRVKRRQFLLQEGDMAYEVSSSKGTV